MEHILKDDEKIEEVIIPGVIFTTPEVGLVGLTEQEAKEAKLNIMLENIILEDLKKALASNETEGFVKIIAEKNQISSLALNAQVRMLQI